MLHVLQAECIKRIIRRELGLCYKCFPVLLHYWSFAGNGIITQFRGKHFHHRTLVKSNLCCSKASVAVRVNQAPSQKHREVLAFICSLAKNKDFTNSKTLNIVTLHHINAMLTTYVWVTQPPKMPNRKTPTSPTTTTPWKALHTVDLMHDERSCNPFAMTLYVPCVCIYVAYSVSSGVN